MNTSILIPTLNAGKRWLELLISIENQSVVFKKKTIIDSGSIDDTVILAKQHGFSIIKIKQEKFDHGYARQILADANTESDILIYLTQDCILADKSSIKNLLSAFSDPKVAIAYGRQLPRVSAKLLEQHARFFNYPALSKVKTIADKNIMGIKTASCSNSFAAYRKAAFDSVGGFPLKSIFGEDVIVGGKLLITGWKIAYVAEATVYHSHNYSPVEEFKRFFDIGVFHKTNKWLLQEFGKADGEGFKYVKSELKTVFKNNILLLPKMVLSTIGKFFGYKLGLNYQRLPNYLRRSFSMHKSYWDKQSK